MPVLQLYDLNHAILLACLTVHCLLGASIFGIVIQYMRLRRGALAAEARLLALPLPADNALPHVLVQLPTFNEGTLIARVARAVKGLDWPRDRLHVQVLDDSADEVPCSRRSGGGQPARGWKSTRS